MSDIESEAAEASHQYVLENVGSKIAYVRVVVYGGTAAIEADLAGNEGFEHFHRAAQCIEKLNDRHESSSSSGLEIGKRSDQNRARIWKSYGKSPEKSI
jgi:hypothetical protein